MRPGITCLSILIHSISEGDKRETSTKRALAAELSARYSLCAHIDRRVRAKGSWASYLTINCLCLFFVLVLNVFVNFRRRKESGGEKMRKLSAEEEAERPIEELFSLLSSDMQI